MHGLLAQFRYRFRVTNYEPAHDKEPQKRGSLSCASEVENRLEFFEEIARRARDIHSAGSAALTVFDALDDAGGFGALRTIGALVGVHDLLTVACLGNLRHNACSPCYECCGARAGCLDGLPTLAGEQNRIIRYFS